VKPVIKLRRVYSFTSVSHTIFSALRHTCPGVRVIYSSSQAVYGQPLPEIVTDSVIPRRRW
jgi:hypothetical protein